MTKKITSVPFGAPQYPMLLKEIPDAPTRLFCIGSLPPPDAICVAIVGTRKATVHGRAATKRIAKELAANGVIIVSGLALGVDTAAHEGAVEAGGKTIAVLANGLGAIYPAQNTPLADRILAGGGTIVSEYPKGTPAYPNQFLERNRIVSGLCVATIVAEAPERSGTLATARFALEQGRDVFVIPGPADHPNYAGSHRLIRDGARLVATTQDIFDDLGIASSQRPAPQQSLFGTATTTEGRVLIKTLAAAGKPLSVDKLAELTTIEAHAINAALTLLLVDGAVKETESGYSI